MKHVRNMLAFITSFEKWRKMASKNQVVEVGMKILLKAYIHFMSYSFAQLV